MGRERGDLRRRYRRTGPWYDLLDALWERTYRRWRPAILSGLAPAGGRLLEVGVGTGRNLAHYPAGVRVIGLDLSEAMLGRARPRAAASPARVMLVQADALALPFGEASFEAYVATFLFLVLPDDLQPIALREMARVVRPGGRFRLVEIVYSAEPSIRRRQRLFAPVVRALYGAAFDRRTRDHLASAPDLEVTATRYLKDDTYLLIEGVRRG